MYELTRAQQWVYGKIRATAGVTSIVGQRVYESPAPQNAPLPYVLIDHRAAVDVNVGKGTRLGTQMVMAIEIVTEEQTNLELEPIYDAIDAALQSQSGDLRGLIIDVAQRDSSYAEWGVESGTVRRHVGALWHLFVRPQALAP